MQFEQRTHGGEYRQRALQNELVSLMGVVSPASMVDLLLERAFEIGATDIHFDPRDDGLHIRLRVDGMLHDILQLTPDLVSHVISRLKLMAGMDITEKRLAQDGHISKESFQHHRDIRVGSGPTIHGERLVLRLVPDGSRYSKLEDLGFDENQIETVKRFVSAPYGMMLSAGPVGSGKSTTVYSCMEMLNKPGRSLVSIEDPVERRMKGVNQIQTDSKVNFGFVEALRGVLRQDPDVIMVGEIRDPETAQIGTRAGLTGIRVLSTMHAQDCAATIDVLRDFKVPAMFIADSINCIIAQRLLRKTCETSRESYVPDEITCRMLGVDPEKSSEHKLTRGIPADANFYTGYYGRMGVFEVMPVDGRIREGILHGRSSRELTDLGVEGGMTTLEQSARRKVLAGQTTLEEMHRVMTLNAGY